jgi:hypothetical protein
MSRQRRRHVLNNRLPTFGEKKKQMRNKHIKNIFLLTFFLQPRPQTLTHSPFQSHHFKKLRKNKQKKRGLFLRVSINSLHFRAFELTDVERVHISASHKKISKKKKQTKIVFCLRVSPAHHSFSKSEPEHARSAVLLRGRVRLVAHLFKRTQKLNKTAFCILIKKTKSKPLMTRACVAS